MSATPPKPPTASHPPLSLPRQHARADIVSVTRELFWHNVVSEFLTTLSALYARGGAASEDGDNPFDGRLAIITDTGVRVPIGAVTPVFACGVGGTREDRALSMAVECTVFEIITPTGESFTLPVHEVRALHALTPELIERIRREVGGSEDSPEGSEMPFGFAAFTSLARSRDNPPAGPLFVGPDFPLPV
jgi:hypothetical protein